MTKINIEQQVIQINNSFVNRSSNDRRCYEHHLTKCFRLWTYFPRFHLGNFGFCFISGELG